jgi:uncharacterized coiled-coil protein SlyX
MSIEQKIAEILAEAKLAGAEGGSKTTTEGAGAAEASHIAGVSDGVTKVEGDNPDNKRNNVEDEKEAEGGTSKVSNQATAKAEAGDQSVIKPVKEDMDALFNGEELTEEFRQKAETIFEAAVMTRVKAEVARIEEEFESKLAEQVAKNVEGLVEQVDGYLGYVAEQWMAQNEIALDRGMKSEVLESFVTGMKSLFEEHYIDVPEERYDVLGEMETRIEELEAKLNEQVATNIEMSKTIAEQKRGEIVKAVSEGLTDTETEKFNALVEELSYEDAETFETKVKTIRENYFTNKSTADVKSVVTDAPVEALTEEKKVDLDPQMSAYLTALNKLK